MYDTNEFIALTHEGHENGYVKARVKIKNHGGYDGAKGMTFPLELEAMYSRVYGWVDVKIDDLVKHGYSLEAGGAQVMKDYCDETSVLCFIVGGECEILEVLG